MCVTPRCDSASTMSLEYAGIRKMAALRPEWTFVWLAAEAGLLRGLDHSSAREDA